VSAQQSSDVPVSDTHLPVYVPPINPEQPKTALVPSHPVNGQKLE
jgi:hypothetical protein